MARLALCIYFKIFSYTEVLFLSGNLVGYNLILALTSPSPSASSLLSGLYADCKPTSWGRDGPSALWNCHICTGGSTTTLFNNRNRRRNSFLCSFLGENQCGVNWEACVHECVYLLLCASARGSFSLAVHPERPGARPKQKQPPLFPPFPANEGAAGPR